MPIRVQSRYAWLFVLIFHAVVGAGWLLAMPGGFPLLHPRFWANRVVPFVTLVTVLVSLLAAWRGKLVVARMVLIALAGAWGAVAISAIILFPHSAVKLTPVAAVACGVVWLSSYSAVGARIARRDAMALAFLGGVVGATLPFTQRAPTASTHPLSTPSAEDAPALPMPNGYGGSIRLTDSISVSPSDGSVMLQHGPLMLDVHPLLTFISRSPDRCWTSLATRAGRTGARRELIGQRLDGSRVDLSYRDDDGSRLAVTSGTRATLAHVDAMSRVPTPIYSHLNYYTLISIAGGKRLAIEFSPCPIEPIEICHSDYPIGRPARSAFLNADGVFRVVQARNAEKGPFTDLAVGKLGRGDPLTMTVHSGGSPVARVTLHDWSAQLSTDLSPTAGWGHPQNAIEFSLDSPDERSPATIFVALAATSMGRGWDSVGHAAGTYRNRIDVELLDNGADARLSTGRTSR